MILEAIEKAGYSPGEQVAIALDPASSEFYDDEKKKYIFKKSDKREKTCRGDGRVLLGGLGQAISHRLASKTAWPRTIGTAGSCSPSGSATSSSSATISSSPTPSACSRASKKAANSILIKLNQIGTVTETIEAIELGRRYGYTSIISHRSGETEDSFIADFAVATSAGQIKTGSASRTDRIGKYNQLLRIEEQLGQAAEFLGIESLNFQ